jgi:hypothetical protein
MSSLLGQYNKVISGVGFINQQRMKPAEIVVQDVVEATKNA